MFKAPIISIILILILKAGFAQKHNNTGKDFNLDVYSPLNAPRTLVLVYAQIEKGWINDTAELNNGLFTFTGKVVEPLLARLYDAAYPDYSISFFIEPGNQTIHLLDDSLKNFTATGSVTQKEWEIFNNTNALFQQRTDSLYSKSQEVRKLIKSTTNPDTITALQQQLKFFDSAIDSCNRVASRRNLLYVNKHKGSFVSSTLLYGLLTSRRVDTKTANIFFSNLSQDIQDGKIGKLIADELAKRSTGIPATDFTAKDINHKTVVLSAMKGKHILLNFWASWCSPCIDKIPGLLSMYKTHHDKGFEVINISIDSKKENWIKAIERLRLMTWINLLASDNPSLTEKYSNITMPIPSEILINQQGVVIWNSANKNLLKLEEVLSISLNNYKVRNNN